MDKILSVKGMNDLLPGQTGLWQHVEARLRQVARQYGYHEIRTPMVEKTELFTQSLGDQTDIVEKEMYTFNDAGNVSLTLRPEATASTVRACNQHGLLYNRRQRLWYMGPMFRRENPQQGRYRQFYQFGLEAFGWSGPDIDAEIIQASARIWKLLDISGVVLHLNTLGSSQTRQAYRAALQAYLADYVDQLDQDSRQRLQRNPLRILDSKVTATQQILQQAPVILDFLDDAARRHFDGLCGLLDQAGVEYQINPRLVRGLDYYTGTAFEWVTQRLGAQNAVCAGGRYDDLVGQRSGKDAPAIGFALGIERLIELVDDSAVESTDKPDICLVVLRAEQAGLAGRLGETLRDADFDVVNHGGGGKVKNQIKRAAQSGAKLAIIIGAEDQPGDQVAIKVLRTLYPAGAAHRPPPERHQENVKVDDVVPYCLTVTGERAGDRADLTA